MQLVPYQLAWIADKSPQKAAAKARRIGFSEATALEIACNAVGLDLVRGELCEACDENIISASHSQAKDLLKKALVHVKALGLAAAGALVAGDNASVVRLANGREIRALSSNPRTIRGYSGNVTLDEFAHVPKQKDVWAAAGPIAKPTLGRRRGYQMRVISSPNGDGDVFHEIVHGKRASKFSVHVVDVHTASQQGFPLSVQRDGVWVPGTVEDLREEIGDPDAFAQEYECSFLSASTRYISAELWDACSYHFSDLPDGPAILYGGMDVARHRDASAIVRAELKGETLWHRDTEAERGMPWPQQAAWVDRLIEPCAKLAIDETGIGSQFAEELEARHMGRVERVTFTNMAKEELATGMKLALDRKRFRPRFDDVELRRDVLLLRREVTRLGNIRFDAPRTKSGHADRAWAAGLCVYASGGVTRRVGVPEVLTSSMARDTREQEGDWGRPRKGGMWGR